MTEEEFDAAVQESRRTATLASLLRSVKDSWGDFRGPQDLLEAADIVLPGGRHCARVLTEEEQQELFDCWSALRRGFVGQWK